jgi:P2-related tail formation protein
MIELHEVGLVEGLPPDVAKEPWVQILDAVFRERRKKELEAAERLKIYTDIDRADEAVLDILAVQFRVDWYDTSYPIETKRRIIKLRWKSVGTAERSGQSKRRWPRFIRM